MQSGSDSYRTAVTSGLREALTQKSSPRGWFYGLTPHKDPAQSESFHLDAQSHRLIFQ